MARRALGSGGERVFFDAASDAQIEPRGCSEQHKRGKNSLVSFGQNVEFGMEREKVILKNPTNDAGMSMKTKDHCGKLGNDTGMSMKTQALSR